MKLRVIKVGCFGGGTGLPSILGGLKTNPWVDLHAVVTMFDSGGSSGQLRDELGVLPPGDVLKCALTLARNEREARAILLTRLPMLEHGRLAGHTGGNLLLSMMEQYTGGDFLAAVDGLRALLGCRGHVWPITVQRSTICAQYADGYTTRGEVEVDAGQVHGRSVGRLWLDPPVAIHPAVAAAIGELDAVIIGPGSFFTSLLPIFLVDGCRDALAHVRGPIIYVANLLTEGRGMAGFTAADAVRRLADAIGRPIDAIVFNSAPPSSDVLQRYAQEHKAPLELGDLPDGCQLIEGAFWRHAIARHDRRRLRGALWALLVEELLGKKKDVSTSNVERRTSPVDKLGAT
ncbi:MAG TPA: gluconeogenesis factor YvcK family protein [Vicinamibacterales bacterium]|nr:gluconeogenesis factor YvcK family protein [Vicinamibacterales bacterium]